MTTRPGVLLLIAGLLSIASPAPGEDGPATLVVSKLRIRSASAGDAARPRDRLVLEARFASELLASAFDPQTEGLSVTLGPVAATSFPPLDEAAKLASRQPWRWTYREKRSPTRPGIRRIKLDLAAGRLRIRAKRLDLSALDDPAGVAVTLVLGETVFTTEIDLDAKGSRWGFDGPDRLPPPQPPEDPPGSELGDPLPFRLLADGDSLFRTPQNLVIRTQEDWVALFTIYRGDPPPEPKFPVGVGDSPPPSVPPPLPPEVDFTKEMVVAVFLGTRPTGGFAAKIESIRTAWYGFHVDYRETRPGAGCVVTASESNPFAIVAVERVAGSASFEGETRVVNCR